MIGSINQALKSEYGWTNNPECTIKKIKLVSKDVARVTFVRVIREEIFGVAISIEAARSYANKRIRYRLTHHTNTFDGEYLLRHIPGGFDAHIEDCPSEAQKHARVAVLGLDVESAAEDYRAGYGRYELDWIAGACDAARPSGKRAGDAIYWIEQ